MKFKRDKETNEPEVMYMNYLSDQTMASFLKFIRNGDYYFVNSFLTLG